MYVTRPLSVCRRSPQSLSLPPPEGPNSGYLVLHDDDSVEINCCGCEDDSVNGLPFPQNKDLRVGYGSDGDDVAFIPVLNQPLSSNRYHVIPRTGRHKGEACTNTREEDTYIGCCGCKNIPDAKPKPLDPSDIYQQIEIVQRGSDRSQFFAKSVDPDGFPPYFLRRKGWGVTMSKPRRYRLGEASGLISSLRASLPGFEFPLSHDCSEVVCVGKWYCPFMFVKEGGVKLKDQMKYSMYYEIKLEQRWEKIFDTVNENAESKKNPAVFVDAFVQSRKRAQSLSKSKDGAAITVRVLLGCVFTICFPSGSLSVSNPASILNCNFAKSIAQQRLSLSSAWHSTISSS